METEGTDNVEVEANKLLKTQIEILNTLKSLVDGQKSLVDYFTAPSSSTKQTQPEKKERTLTIYNYQLFS